MFQKEIEFYKNARIADEGLHTFQLCGQMDGDPNDRWAVAGEVGYEWLEVHEVGTYFNFEEWDENYDGAFYYVGNTSLEPLRPHHSELDSSVAHCKEFGWDLDYSTKLGVKLLEFGESYVMPPIVLAMEMFSEFRKTQLGSRIWFELSEQEKDGWIAVAEWIIKNKHLIVTHREE